MPLDLLMSAATLNSYFSIRDADLIIQKHLEMGIFFVETRMWKRAGGTRGGRKGGIGWPFARYARKK
jgi:hypothetical protein